MVHAVASCFLSLLSGSLAVLVCTCAVLAVTQFCVVSATCGFCDLFFCCLVFFCCPSVSRVPMIRIPLLFCLFFYFINIFFFT